MNTAAQRLRRWLLSPLLLLLLATYFAQRALRAVLKTQWPAKPGQRRLTEHAVSVYDTPIPDIHQLGPANSWRQMWQSVPCNSRVLDLGCSTGYLGAWLIQTRGCIVDGVDIFDGDLAQARTRLHAVYKGDLERDDWSNQLQDSYDVVLMMDVLEHVRNPNSLLTAARTLLKPDGILIVNVPNVANWRLRFELLRGRWNYQDSGLMDRTHVYFYTIDSLRTLLSSNGYRVSALIPTVPGTELLGFDLARLPIGAQLQRALLYTFPDLLAYQLMAQSHPQSS